MGWRSAQLYPTSEGSPTSPLIPPQKSPGDSFRCLSELQDKGSEGLAIVATERCLQPHLPPPQAPASRCRTLRKGDSPPTLRNWPSTSVNWGMNASPPSTRKAPGVGVETSSTFSGQQRTPRSPRGFGDELDKLREFDPASQRSLDPVEHLRLTPTGFSPDRRATRESMPDGLDQLLSEEQLGALLDGQTPEGMRRLMGLAWEQPASLLDYLPNHCSVVIDERRHGQAHGQQWLDHAEEHHKELL